MKKQLAWILGGASIVGLGMVASLNACSGDTQTTDAGGKDSTATKDQAVNDTSTQDQSTGQDTGVQDAGADCKTPNGPFTTDGGPFCPFQQGADGGTLFSDCQNGQHCCIPGSTSTPSTCQASTCTFAADAATNADFQCNESNDCPNNQVCCENAGAEVQQDPGCTSYWFVSKQHGTTCMNSCPSGQAQICGSSADCKNGGTCVPVNTKAIWLGACQAADGGF
jgi:hypothetical protein